MALDAPNPRPRARSGVRTAVIGVTGAPAAGKSTVAAMLGDLGAVVVDADALAHEALDCPRVARSVVRLLGAGVRGADRGVDRAAVARRVFGPGGATALRRLTGLLHPLVLRRMRAEVAAARSGGAPAVVLDVPLLFESGLDRDCDFTVFVDAPKGVRRARARARGWSARDLGDRESRQAPAAERRRRADGIVDNGGSRSEARRQARALWARALDAAAGTGNRRA